MARHGRSPVRKAVVALLVLVVIAALAWAYRAERAREEAEMQLGLDSARVLTESFRATNQLKVSQLSGDIIVRNRRDGFIDALDVEQRLKVPYTVDYFIDMRGIDSADFAWDPDSATMIVEIPDVLVAAPNIDMAEARIEQDGLWVSRKAGQALVKSATGVAKAKTTQVAQSPRNIAQAEDAALRAIRRNVSAPLAAAGLGDVTVDVRLKSRHNTNDDVWDYTTRIDQVEATLERMRK